MAQNVIVKCHGVSNLMFEVRSVEDLYPGNCSHFKENHRQLLCHKKMVFAPQICQASFSYDMGQNVMFKCHGLSNLMFEVRAVEDLYPENCSHFKGNH